MQFVYPNTYKNYAVHEIYEAFVARTYNHQKKFVDVYPIANASIKYLNLNMKPVEYVDKPIVNVYASDVAFNAGTVESVLVEWTDYNIDYELGILNFTSTYTPVVGKVIEIIGFYVNINLYQFSIILNSALRYLNKYFPSKWLYEYTAAMAWLAPTDPQEIDRVNLTQLPFLDINTVWSDINARYDVPFARRGEYIIFNGKQKEYRTDFGMTIKEEVKQPVPFWIEGNLKPDQVHWDKMDITGFKNQVFRFPEIWYDALILYLRIQMYTLRLEYNQDINVSTLKLNTMDIYSLLRELKAELATMVGDSSISKWFFPAWVRDERTNTLSTTLS